MSAVGRNLQHGAYRIWGLNLGFAGNIPRVLEHETHLVPIKFPHGLLVFMYPPGVQGLMGHEF